MGHIGLRVVSARSALCCEDILSEVSRPVQPSQDMLQLMAKAAATAANTVSLIRAEGEPAHLASIVCAITDQPFRVAFLEAIADHLLR